MTTFNFTVVKPVSLTYPIELFICAVRISKPLYWSAIIQYEIHQKPFLIIY